MNKEIVLFDINETVLNLNSLKPAFSEAFGSDEALPRWFSTLLHASTVCISTKVQTQFAELAGVALDSMSAKYHVELTDTQRTALLVAFANLKPHSDIRGALETLRSHGFKTVAFSNSSLNLISAQMRNSGLDQVFDEIISVEETGSFKPDPRVYEFAARTLGVSVGDLRLVATHDWDTHGALSAGLKAAYIDRSGVPYHPLYLKPDIQSATMDGIVEQIIAIYSSS
ncbi:haloacid dehalogenase type II [Enterovibrio calviensis]|uniref:haloacid dehalogenase type II n=1 Tax=Enterovibrio calviensis TaxID=91359 RepID=UPI000481790D|nr:haloacid dehalogenase type II [Enterovibrio calviensis]